VQAFNAGSLYNTGPHPVDQALQLAGFDGVPEVRAYMNRVNTWGDAEDYAKVIMHQPGKPVTEVEVSCCNVYPTYTMLIHAQRGGLRATTDRIDYRYYVPEEAPDQKLILTPISQPDGTPAYCREPLVMYDKVWELPAECTDLFTYNTKEFYKMLHGVLTEGKPLAISLEEVRTQIAVMEEAHRQNPLSKTVSI
jgi:predicted dehydrogenase